MTESPPTRRNHTLGGWIYNLVVVLAVIGLAIFLLTPAKKVPVEYARRHQCKNNLKQIGLALLSYHDMYQSFPMAYTFDSNRKRLHSWRTAILPWLDQALLYNRIDTNKPWDDPVNGEVRKKTIPYYSCPSVNQGNKTTYMAVLLPEGIFPPIGTGKLSKITRTLSDVVDDKKQTLLVVEVDPEYAVEWMAPEDATADMILKKGTKSSKVKPHSFGVNAVLVSGEVRFLNDSLSREIIHALMTINGGEKVDENF